MADRNGNAITPNASYLLVGRALRDDGSTVLVDLGYRVVSATANEIAPAVGGIGTAMLGADITAAGKALLDDADATAQRATLGLGTAATRNMGVGPSDLIDLGTMAATFATLAHTHNGTDSPLLTQARTHQSPDTDSATSALHHTLGTGANQAAAGNHTHAAGAITGLATIATSGSASDLGTGTVPTARLSGIGTGQLGGDITTAGKALLDDASASAQRTTLGLGTSATLNVYGSGDPLGVLTAIASFAGLIHTHAPTDITGASSDGQVLRRASGVVGWGTIPSASVTGLGTAATQNTYGSGDPLGVITAISVFSAIGHAHAAGDITSGTLATARGGTGQGSYSTGDILYWNGTTLAKLAIGSEGQVLKVESGVPKWSDP